ncbi:aminotransferase class V-fold PLP-dependent enzyme [Ammonicoccus fulvus]|uniref:Aminotransferase class V-fold PLP-dependent enzyme n=1 Tax=Ammonicoccus fulvus TaxID=3138240 RepID=A0ABZ3FJL9_9ACTN
MTADWPWADHFDADGIYLATATTGVPPRATSDAMTDILDRWRRGRVSGPVFDPIVAESRERYARLVGVEASTVAIAHQASALVALIAGSLPDGAEVVVADGEFTSVTFPFAVHERRGVRLKVAPLAEIADHISGDTALVAVSAVQSANGAIADFDAIEAAAARHGADVLIDLTQSAGWLPVDASRFAYTVCAAYKWLLAPRGTAFLTVRADRLEAVVPFQAGWYAGAYPWESIYGLPLRLAEDARRFDVSPAWFSWVGTRASLEFLEDVGRDELHRHALELEAAFAQAAEVAIRGQAIRSFATDPEVAEIMAAEDVTASVRAGKLRLSFHVNNTVDEAVRVGELLRGRISD